MEVSVWRVRRRRSRNRAEEEEEEEEGRNRGCISSFSANNQPKSKRIFKTFNFVLLHQKLLHSWDLEL